MNMQREIPLKYHTVEVVAVGWYDAGGGDEQPEFSLDKVMVGATDVLPMLGGGDVVALESAALRVIEEGR